MLCICYLLLHFQTSLSACFSEKFFNSFLPTYSLEMNEYRTYKCTKIRNVLTQSFQPNYAAYVTIASMFPRVTLVKFSLFSLLFYFYSVVRTFYCFSEQKNNENYLL